MKGSSRTALAALLLVLLPLASPQGEAQGGESRVVVLLHHPFDRIDPFGIPVGDCPRNSATCADTFTSRRGGLAQNGRFDFPTFVADGVEVVSALPDPGLPFASTLGNYSAAVESRLRLGSPGTLSLRGHVQETEGGQISVEVAFTPAADFADPQRPLHVLVAVLEDFIHYQPDARISNGVTEHRFTVRALRDAGPLAGNHSVRFAAPASWDRANLIVAAWLEAPAAFGRYAPGEAVQAAWARADGAWVHQAGKAVLVEVYSATWCAPCLYGDLAAEELAVQYGGAAKAPPPRGAKYFEAPAEPVLAVALAAFTGLAAFAWTKRRP
jgi:thiol-disulfide isomerase/thioredoxin